MRIRCFIIQEIVVRKSKQIRFNINIFDGISPETINSATTIYINSVKSVFITIKNGRII